MTLKEHVTEAIDALEEPELQEVADYLAFLKFRSRSRAVPHPDDSALAGLYAEFGAEDRSLAEEGMADYQYGLAAEDAK